MQILNAEQLRAWDEYTIAHEPIASIDLMERAAAACVSWIEGKGWQQKQFIIFCGKGNNGGDGLAIARMLLQRKYLLDVFILENGKTGSKDFETNLERLQQISPAIVWIKDEEQFAAIPREAIVIDALFGSGLNKPLNGVAAGLVRHINSFEATIVSLDLPSGLFIDRSSRENSVISASHTLSFQCYKPALLLQENDTFIGRVTVLDIGLHQEYLKSIEITSETIDAALVQEIYKPRKDFSHKGNFGHALLVAGSFGKMGAATLAARACVKTGAGLTTAFIPRCGHDIMQVSVPEAMVITAADVNKQVIASLPDEMEKYSVIGIGPGLGVHEETKKSVSFIVRRYQRPLVIDADGLNCLALQPELLQQLPSHSILTPHPKEFERLFGKQQNDFERVDTASRKAAELNIILVVKSHHTLVALPDGRKFFNTTGNAGLAKGGSGDVLTGIITSLVAQGYAPAQAAIFGVYLHGLAGDAAAARFSQEAMTAGDVIDCLGDAFQMVKVAD